MGATPPEMMSDLNGEGLRKILASELARCLVWSQADTLLWRAGSAGKLQVQLVDTSSNTGSAEPLATATVDLDMRQWKESKTYQAEVPLVTEGVLTATVIAAKQLNTK